MGKIIAEKCSATVSIANISIYPYKLTGIPVTISDEEVIIQHIVEQSRFLDDVEWNKFLSDSSYILSLDQYEKWLGNNGLASKSDAQAISLISSLSDLSNNQENCYNDIFLHEILSPKTISFCYGQSRAGKSIWALTVALSYACGFDIFDFSSREKKKVLYIDYETKKGIFSSIVNQIILAYSLDKTLVDTNFKFLLKDEKHEVTNIWDEKQPTSFFQHLIKDITGSGISLIIIDTLVKAAPKSLNSFSNAVAFMDFLQQINEKYNISFLIIHHSNKDGDMDGSSVFFKNATNAFNIIKESITGNFKGVYLKVVYTKVKMAPQLENSESSYTLQMPQSIEKVRPWLEIKGISTISRTDSITQKKTIIPWDTSIHDEEQNNIINTLYMYGKAMSICDIQLKAHFDKTTATLRNVIKKINNKSKNFKIISMGKGRNSKYLLQMSTDGE